MKKYEVSQELINDENGGHGYVEFGSIGKAVVQVFRANDNDKNGNEVEDD